MYSFYNPSPNLEIFNLSSVASYQPEASLIDVASQKQAQNTQSDVLVHALDFSIYPVPMLLLCLARVSWPCVRCCRSWSSTASQSFTLQDGDHVAQE